MIKKKGLNPIYDKDSLILILGTFPSQESRDAQAYYSNKRNRFWKVISDFFGVSVPETYEKKIELLHQHKIALWDLIEECEICGSSNKDIKEPKYNNIAEILQQSDIKLILLNGKDTLKMYESNFKDLNVPYKYLPSTSPITPKFDIEKWFEALSLEI